MKKVLAGIVLGVFLLGLAFLNQHLTQKEIEREYLHTNRPDVVAAIEAYHAANGHYPDSITNAVPAYYHGNQVKIFFLQDYAYKTEGNSYYLRTFGK